MSNFLRQHSRSLVCALSMSVLAACGGGGGSDNVASGGGQTQISKLDAATYLIGITVNTSQGTQTQLFGTGFAIEPNLIATNAHVTKGVLDTARQLAAGGGTVVGVSAFQSETGLEVPLLEATVHPSYTGSTRSPDVGLFVTRTAMPNVLELESPEAASTMRKGDAVQVNGFPGDVNSQIFSLNGFQPGLSVAQASLFSGTIQAIRNFDERVVVVPPTVSVTDQYEYSMDTSPGTSGSPLLRDGKVVGVHNSGVINIVVRPGPNNQLTVDREILATASFGVHVKHLHNMIAEYRTGVLEADKRFRLPPPPELVNSAPAGGGGQNGGQALIPAGGISLAGNVFNPNNANVSHQIQVNINEALAVSGSTSWPANPSLGLNQRSFTLQGGAQPSGRLEIRDNTPELIPGFRRGVYIGNLNPASGTITGQYYEHDEANNELYYFGDWTARR